MKNTTTAETVNFLFIDDDPLLGNFLTNWLKSKRCTAAAATNVFDATTMLLENVCEVVVVDLYMPNPMGGASIIARIRELNEDLPIIVFTGVGYDEAKMHAALRAGANGYLSKNLPIDQLYCVLDRVLRTSRQRKERAANGGISTR